jgi:predicted DNA-binding protein
MGKRQMTDLDLLDMSAEEAGEFVDNAVAGPIPTEEEQAELLAELPRADRGVPITVVTSLRLPHELKQRVDAAAAADGISASTFIRQSLERVLAGRERTNLVNLDDVIRAVRSLPHAA